MTLYLTRALRRVTANMRRRSGQGRIIYATIMAATASINHRVIDVAIAAEFMAAVCDLAEVPMQIVE